MGILMKQVKNEYAIFRLAVALRNYDNANPDVGMGPSDGYFIHQAAQQLDLAHTDYDFAAVEALMRAKR